MLKSVLKYATLFATTLTALCSADCQTTFEVGVGYRRDFTKWDTKTTDIDGTKISSSIRFKDQDIFLVDAKAKMIEDWFYFRADADFGWLTAGKAHDKISITNMLGNTFASHDDNSLKKGSHVADVTAALGYPFEFCCGDFIIAPVVGYAYRYQRIETREEALTTADFRFVQKEKKPLQVLSQHSILYLMQMKMKKALTFLAGMAPSLVSIFSGASMINGISGENSNTSSLNAKEKRF